MKSLKILPIIVISSSLLLVAAQMRRDSPLRLIQIAKAQGELLQVLSRGHIDIRQELQSSYLALANGIELRYLIQNRIQFSLLCRSARGKEFLLVPMTSVRTIEELQARGQVRTVEAGTFLFWADEADSLAVLPPEVPRKPLSSRSILSYLRPTFSLEGGDLVAAEGDPNIALISERVSEDNLREMVQSLQDFQTRYASTANCEAAGQFLYNYFQVLGLNVWFQPFTFGASEIPTRNVIAEKAGETYPNDIVIICGHYDSISPSATRMVLAPGADDNASGMAAVMEAARILVDIPLDFSVRFIAFSAEEWGLYGSEEYSIAARQANERIVGVIDLDMIAFADAVPEDLEIVVNESSDWLANRLVLAAENYTPLSTRKIVNASFTYSDHAPFWDNGYPALLAIEDLPLNNPYYHQTTDTVDTLDFEFFGDSTSAALALLAELAQPLRIGYPQTPGELVAETAVYSSLFRAIRDVRLSWPAQTGVSGYNVYRSSVSHLNYERINETVVLTTTFNDPTLDSRVPYYYVVTAVDAAGFESNYSREVEILPPLGGFPSENSQAWRLFRMGGIR